MRLGSGENPVHGISIFLTISKRIFTGHSTQTNVAMVRSDWKGEKKKKEKRETQNALAGLKGKTTKQTTL